MRTILSALPLFIKTKIGRKAQTVVTRENPGCHDLMPRKRRILGKDIQKHLLVPVGEVRMCGNTVGRHGKLSGRCPYLHEWSYLIVPLSIHTEHLLKLLNAVVSAELHTVLIYTSCEGCPYPRHSLKQEGVGTIEIYRCSRS